MSTLKTANGSPRCFFTRTRIHEMIDEQKRTGDTLATIKYSGHRYVWIGVYGSRAIDHVQKMVSSWGFHVIKRDGELYARRK